MSDQESEVSQSGSDASWAAAGPFSTNGNDPGDGAVATEDRGQDNLDDRTKFLSDLARVMQTTAIAEQARNAEGTEQRRQTHIEGIRAREALEVENLRELAKDDVKGIDAWSDGEIKRIKLERERRIASRREQLQIRLEEHRSVVAREVDAVEAAVAAYKVEVEQFFAGLEAETDPIAIARQAGNQPKFPDLALIGWDDAVANEYGYVVSASAEPEAVSEPISEVVSEAGSDEAVAEAGSEVVPEAVSDEAVAEAGHETGTEGPSDDQVADHGSELIGVMDPAAGDRVVETPWDSGVAPAAEAGPSEGPEASEGSVTPEGSEGSEELEPVAAEAQVVMPRSSGAGSWLRWPSSSVDRSDPGR